MEYDWNWFFSSLSQSAAALIGIIGAFIISRLLGLSEKINSSISDFDNLVIQFNKLKQNLADRHFYWYTRTNVRYSSELKESITNGDFDNLKENEIIERIYNLDNDLYKVNEAVMEAYNEIIEKIKPKVMSSNIDGYSFLDKTIVNLDIPPAGIWNELSKEKDTINQLKAEANTLIQYFNQNSQNFNSFSDSINPLKIIIILLMIAFPLTVVYPLHFMPVISNQNPTITFNILVIPETFFTLKTFLLTSFLLIIEGVFFYFIIVAKNFESKLINAKAKNSEDYRNLNTYCEYL